MDAPPNAPIAIKIGQNGGENRAAGSVFLLKCYRRSKTLIKSNASERTWRELIYALPAFGARYCRHTVSARAPRHGVLLSADSAFSAPPGKTPNDFAMQHGFCNSAPCTRPSLTLRNSHRIGSSTAALGRHSPAWSPPPARLPGSRSSARRDCLTPANVR